MKRILLGCFIGLLVITLTGCWDYRPLDEDFMITGLGIDHSLGDESKLEVTVFGVAYTEQDHTLSGQGSSISEAISEIQDKTEKFLSFSHIQILLISKSVAKKGISSIIDVMLRDSQVRNFINVALVDGRVSDFLQKGKEYPVTGSTFEALLKSADLGFPNQLLHLETLAMNLYSGASGFILPILKIDKVSRIISLKGFGVFKRDRFLEEIDRKQMIGFLLLMQRLEYANLTIGTINLDNPDQRVYSVKIKAASTHVRVVIDKDQPTFIYDLGFSGALLEKNPVPLGGISADEIKRIESELTEELKKSMLNVLRKIQKDQIEPFGLGEYARVYWPKGYKEAQWEEQFSKAKIETNIQVNLVFYGQTL